MALLGLFVVIELVLSWNLKFWAIKINFSIRERNAIMKLFVLIVIRWKKVIQFMIFQRRRWFFLLPHILSVKKLWLRSWSQEVTSLLDSGVHQQKHFKCTKKNTLKSCFRKVARQIYLKRLITLHSTQFKFIGCLSTRGKSKFLNLFLYFHNFFHTRQVG